MIFSLSLKKKKKFFLVVEDCVLEPEYNLKLIKSYQCDSVLPTAYCLLAGSSGSHFLYYSVLNILTRILVTLKYLTRKPCLDLSPRTSLRKSFPKNYKSQDLLARKISKMENPCSELLLVKQTQCAFLEANIY